MANAIYPYATALTEFSMAAGEFGEAAKGVERMNIESTRKDYEEKRATLTRLYNEILTKLQQAGIEP